MDLTETRSVVSPAPVSPSKKHPNYHTDSHGTLRNLKRKTVDLDNDLVDAHEPDKIVDIFCSKMLVRYDQIKIHQWELNRQYSLAGKKGGPYADLVLDYDTYRERWNELSSQAGDVAQQTLTAKRRKRILTEALPGYQHDRAIQVIQAFLAEQTFGPNRGFGTLKPEKPRSRERAWRSELHRKYNLKFKGQHQPPRDTPPPVPLVISDFDDDEAFTAAIEKQTTKESNLMSREFELCQVSGVWYLKSEAVCRGAHLIPHRLAGLEMEALCGIDDASVDSFRNGLCMYGAIEQQFDAGNLVFVPTQLQDPTEWKVVLINPKLLQPGFMFDSMNEWRSLEGRTIMFGSHERPSRTCMYFRYVMAWLHASQSQQSMLTNGHKLRGIRFFTPSSLVNRSVLSALATQAGDHELWTNFERAQDAKAFEKDEDKDERVNTEKELQGTVLARLWRAFIARTSPTLLVENQVDDKYMHELEKLSMEYGDDAANEDKATDSEEGD